MKRLLLALMLLFPLGATAEQSLEEVKALHMKNCLANGGLKEICSCSFDESLQLVSLKEIEKYNQMVAAGYSADIKTTGRLTRATMNCNQKLRTNEAYRQQAEQDQGLLPPPPPPPIPGSVYTKPEPLPKASNTDTSGIQDKSLIGDAMKAAMKPSEVPPPPPLTKVAPPLQLPKETPIVSKPLAPVAKKPVAYTRKPKPKPTAPHYFGEYDRMFFESAKRGDLEGLRAYAATIPDLDVQNEAGDTALITAARFGQIVSLKFLLANKVDANITNAKGQTALHIASYAKRIDMVEQLLKSGANPNIAYGKGYTPLTLAIMQQDSVMARTLLAAKAAVNTLREDGNNELHIAATGTNTDIIQQLVRAGVDKNKLNKAGNTPLMVASYAGNAKSVQALLNLGADPNITDQYGRTALTLANSAGMRQTSALLMRVTQGR